MASRSARAHGPGVLEAVNGHARDGVHNLGWLTGELAVQFVDREHAHASSMVIGISRGAGSR
jgi:hypothetical protein